MVSSTVNQSKNESHAPKTKEVELPGVSVGGSHIVFTVVELLLSLTAFILEELIITCTSCLPLYYFEFASFTASLFTLLFLIVGFMDLPRTLDIPWLSCLELFTKMAVCALFFIASIVFFYNNDRTQLEMTAMAFGFLATFVFMTDIGIHVKMGMLMKADRPSVIKKGANSCGVPHT
ncbi:CKLF-like MARVEL transmembrane domain-containing protein 6 [Scleropages formosus]|uniref:CKLF-like MARVEL transmembrane domain-containing protein 6 n=1 Tax=Scleropages formosus TaxID=113540 RepID=A0A8C9WBL6_SCLFO|nr:CKLF-like MARVEL transmembrane domain-containing protein 6 [Scleropages formosus]